MDNNLKLLQSINAICDFVIYPNRGIDYYIHKYNKISTGKKDENGEYKKRKANDELPFDIEKTEPLKYMEYVAEELYDIYPYLSKDYIMKKFYEVSGNFNDLYLVLTDEEKYSDLCFKPEEDEIIKNLGMREEDYKSLIFKKGYENILKRKEFLCVNC